jgi:transposase
MNRDLTGSPVVLMDEMTVEVLDEGRGPAGEIVYVDDAGKPNHRFAYFPSQSGSSADSLLKGYKGYYIQTDGYTGYGHIGKGMGFIHVGDFAHIRREYEEAVKTAGNGGIGKEAIEIIGKLYGIEEEMRETLGSGRINADTFVMRRKDWTGPEIKELQELQNSHKAAVRQKVV